MLLENLHREGYGTNYRTGHSNFNVVEFDHFRMHAGLPNFVLSVSEWLHKLNQIAIQQMTVLENVESKHILKA